MYERDSLALCAKPGAFVYQAETVGAAASERAVEIVHREAHVVNAGAALRDKFPDGRIRRLRFEELHEGSAGIEGDDPSAIRVLHCYLGHPEDVAIERDTRAEGADRNSDVRDGRVLRRRFVLGRTLHGH
jgi:hypothetical protein